MAGSLGAVYTSIRADQKKLKGDFNKAYKTTDTFAGRMQKRLNKINFNKFHMAVSAVTVGAVYAFQRITRSIISTGVSFESTMKTVQAWSGATGRELQSLEDIAREMGATTEHSALQSADALKFLAAAGFSVTESISALPGVLELATAGQVDLAAASDIVTDTLTAFGLEVSELNRVSDAFITTASSSNTNVLMLGQSFKMVAPTAKLMGQAIEETAGMLGTLANSGVKAEMAGSGLNMVLLKSQKAAKMLGLDALTPLTVILKKMKEEQWNAVKIGEAFGARQVKTAGILMDNIDAYEALTKKIIENKGATQKLAEIIRDSLGVELKTLESSIQEISLKVFTIFKEDLRELAREATVVAQEFGKWVEANKELIKQSVKAFIKGLLVEMKLLAKVAGAVAKAFWVVGKFIGETAAKVANLNDKLNTNRKALDELTGKTKEGSAALKSYLSLNPAKWYGGQTKAIDGAVRALRRYERDTKNTNQTIRNETKKTSQYIVDGSKIATENLRKDTAKMTLNHLAYLDEINQQSTAVFKNMAVLSGGMLDAIELNNRLTEQDFAKTYDTIEKNTSEFAGIASRSLADGFFDVVKGNVNGLGDIWKTFLDSMVQQILGFLATKAVTTLISFFTGGLFGGIMGGGGGIIGAIGGIIGGIGDFFGGLFHQGGMVKAMHVGGMVELPKAHSGLYIPKLKHDERPIIAQTGEGVLSRRGMRSIGGEPALNAANSGAPSSGGGGSVNITINANVITTNNVDRWLADRMEKLNRFKIGRQYSTINVSTAGIAA